MRIEQQLRQELENVSGRYRRLLVRAGLAATWLVLGAIGVLALVWARGAGYAVPGMVIIALLALAAVVGAGLIAAARVVRDPVWIARRIERRHPDLDARLLAALEQRARDGGGELGYLQQAVIGEALEHARRHRWDRLVSNGKLKVASWAQRATLAAFILVVGTIAFDMYRRPGRAGWWTGGIARNDTPEIKVEPEDTEVERGTGLLVLARFERRLPGEVQLVYQDADGQVRQVPMSKSLDDPVFAGRVASVDKDLTYAVRYGDEQTRWYKVGVFDYPELRQADARLQFPEYTGVPEKVVEDTRSVTAVEGTKATLTFRLNKAVRTARLIPGRRATTAPVAPASQSAVVDLVRDGADPSVYTLGMDLKESQNYRLELVDEQGRTAKQQPELAINVTQNRPPELKLEWPGHDVDVSALEELSVKAQVWDDFGVKRAGVTYAIAGEKPQDVVLAEGVPAKEKRDVAHLVPLETLNAKPDQLVSYFIWAEDVGPDGKVRRTSGDMFFAEVRPFDQIFRQGQQPGADQQQQQQSQQGNQNGQQAEQLAELQKQIIAATWKLARRETAATPSKAFVPDVKTVAESQASAREQATALGEKLEDQRSQAYLNNVLKFMERARAELNAAATGVTAVPLQAALSAEQAAYQELLKLRAREFDVVRGNQQQRQQGGQSTASNRRQQQLNQLELDQQQNRYESQRAAQPQQQENPQERETRQVLNRLRELAQRQEDLNRQMKELQSALEQAKEQQRREELKRQLARLREQQQQMLRDTDELRDRMDQPENQQRMADSRQQLEQTRENVRQASEALDQGKVPQASASGARAQEQLNNLKDEFRKNAAGQFNDAMDRMRQAARDLDQKQQDLSHRLNDLDKAERPALRDSANRQGLADGLGQQKQELEKLLEEMKKTTEAAETAEPLLSRQLYDTLRETRRQNTDQALDVSRQLLERGFVNEARQAEGEAGKGVTKLREGVEQAARSVLGDEAEALRRARNELDALAQELEREIDRKQPAGVASTRPDRRRAELAGGGPTTRAGGETADGRRPGAQPDGRAGTDREASTGPSDRQLAQGGTAGAGTRPSDGRMARGASSQPGDTASENPRDGENAIAQDAVGQAPTTRPSDRQLARGGARQPGDAGRQQGQNPGQQEQNQPSDQPGSQQAQGGEQQGSQPGNQPGEGRQGSPQGGRQAGGQQPGGQGNPQVADAQQDGSQGDPGGNRQGQGAQSGPQRPGGDRQARGGGLRGGGTNAGDREALQRLANGGGSGPEDSTRTGPLTGEGFRDWSDRLRDVEEMVGDPRLRAQAAQIRDRARDMRSEFNRHSKEPNWDVVRDFINRPLVELRDAISQELMRRESNEARVPIDREPVPPEYAEQVRKYYERLGSGR